MEANVVPIVLAAGESRRMGYPKALLPYENSTFLGVILDRLKAAGLPEGVVVLGEHAPRILPVLRQRTVRVATNPRVEQGQISSIQIGIGHLPGACRACLIWPVDQPAVSSPLVRQLVQLFLKSNAPIVMPSCSSRRGHPAIFAATLFPEIVGLEGGEGARGLVLKYEGKIALLPTEERGTIEDVDTPDEYERLTGQSLESALRAG